MCMKKKQKQRRNIYDQILKYTLHFRIGVTEKGFATLELNVEMSPGHSSIPPKETAIGVLAKAVSALETNPHPSMFGNGPEMDFFSYISTSV